jgi:outer membrane protein
MNRLLRRIGHVTGHAASAALLVMAISLMPGTTLASEIKIGYVNTVRVIEEAPQGIAALKKIEAEFGPRDKELVVLQNKIRALEDDLERNGSTMKDSDRSRREREVLTLKRELKRSTQDFREDYNQRRNEELAALQQLVRKVILEIAKQEKYDLIIHEGALYAGEKVDITEKVLKRLGKP